MAKTLKSIPKYGDRGTGDVATLQEALKVTADDWFGDETLKALQKLQKANGLKGTGVIPADGGQTLKLLGLSFKPPGEDETAAPPKTDNFFGAPWVGANIDLLGRSETDPELNARYVPEWKLEGLPGYKTLSGNTHAWCSVRENADMRKVGVKGTNSAGAASWSKWGRKCPFWFGASLDIKHKGGGRHIGDFLYWVDEKRKIAAVLGGNQGNKFSIVATNLSGSGDTLVAGPRWSKDVADGQFVTKAQVLAKYPFLKVGGSMGNTR